MLLLISGVVLTAPLVPRIASTVIASPKVLVLADVKPLEDAGDAARKRAQPHYAQAHRSWVRLEALAKKLGDEYAQQRSRVERYALAALMLNPKMIPRPAGTRVRPDVSKLLEAGATLHTSDAVTPEAKSLTALVRFLKSAEKKFKGQRGRQARDALLLAETITFLHRFSGDLEQRHADQAYRKALALVARGSQSDAVESRAIAAASQVRLTAKLRRFTESKTLAREYAKIFDSLSVRDATRHWEVLRRVAQLEGDDERALALVEQIRKSGAKAEEVARLSTRFPSFALGSGVDIANAAQTLLGVLAQHKLPSHEANLVAHVSALLAVELGEYSLVAKILRSRPWSSEADLWLRASMGSRLGLAYAELGDYEAALHALGRSSEAVASLPGTELFRARLQLNQVRALVGLGELPSARTKALELLRAPDLPAALKVRARLLLAGTIYEDAKKNPRALDDVWRVCRVAERDLEKARSDGLEANIATELAVALAINKANTHRLSALHMAHSAGDASTKSADIAQQQSQAINLQDEALRTADKAGKFRVAAVAAANLGELYLEKGDLASGREFVVWALARAEELKLFETAWRCHWYLARLADAEGRAAEADSEYGKALSAVESYRARIFDFERKSGFLNDKASLYRDLVRRELRRGRVEAALSIVERAKARVLVESLGWRLLPLSDPVEKDLYAQLVSEMGKLERSRRTQTVSLYGARGRSLDYDATRKRVERIRSELIERAKARPELATLVDGNPADAGTIVAGLPRSTALVEYFDVGNRFVAFVLQQGK
ncbi:MAG: hypothetical protein MK538_11235, partial [Planctomycetes bacterium]|nr:hypothetical protein [Planctomycetota bacterium]